MGQSTRTVTNAASTIPAPVSVSTGTVTTNSTKDTVLTYTGAIDLVALFNPVQFGLEGSLWVYVPATTVKLARVLDVELIGTNTYSIFLDRAITGASSTALSYVIGDLKAYSFVNSGGASGVFDYNTVPANFAFSEKIQYPLTVDFLDVKMIDATGTAFIITEDK